MPDRKKVIKGLEHCQRIGSCGDCPYQEDLDPDVGCGMHGDALALLQEQEAVEPKWASGIKGGADALCGSCMVWLEDRLWAYCPRCGRKVKWGD